MLNYLRIGALLREGAGGRAVLLLLVEVKDDSLKVTFLGCFFFFLELVEVLNSLSLLSKMDILLLIIISFSFWSIASTCEVFSEKSWNSSST